MPVIHHRTMYNYDRDKRSLECGTCNGIEKYPDRTVQSSKESADIRVILKRFGLGQQLPVNVRAPVVGDFCGIPDFQTALNRIRSANESFLAMPAELRARLGNNPAEFVAYCSDPRNKDEMRKFGLMKPGEVPVVPPVVVPPVEAK